MASPALMVTATRPTPLQVPGQSKFWTGSHSTLGRLSVSSKLRGGRLGREGSHQPGALHCCATGTACAGCKRRVPNATLSLLLPHTPACATVAQNRTARATTAARRCIMCMSAGHRDGMAQFKEWPHMAASAVAAHGPAQLPPPPAPPPAQLARVLTHPQGRVLQRFLPHLALRATAVW